MTDTPKPDLSEHEEEAVPFDDVMRKLLEAKLVPKRVAQEQGSNSSGTKHD